MKNIRDVVLKTVIALLLLSAVVVGVLYSSGSFEIFSKAGWSQDEQGRRCYLNYWGEKMTGWQLIDENRYYFSPDDGSLATGWLEQEEGIYYLNEQGIPHTGWLQLEEGTYYLNEHCLLCTGWHSIDGADYYFAENGAMVTGWLDFEGERYCLGADGAMQTGWIDRDGERYYLYDDGTLATGWIQLDGDTYYLSENGAMHTGWLEKDGSCYYFGSSGMLHTGWLDREGKTYYLDETGAMVTGWQVIENLHYYFSEDGTKATGQLLTEAVAGRFQFEDSCTIMLDKDNPLPEDWIAYPIEVEDDWSVDGRCYIQFVQMLSDCRAAGNETGINSAYRSPEEQQEIWDNRVALYMDEGDTEEEAIERVSKEVALPGYSEHQLGFAVDIDGFDAHDWMAENSWRYGFIIRYPEDKQDITGTVYEPWHVRYVGEELAAFLYENNLCLEEYYDQYKQ